MCVNCGKSSCDSCNPKVIYKRGPKGEKGDPGKQGPAGIQGPIGPQGPSGGSGTYMYIVSIFAAGEVQINDSDWHIAVVSPYDNLNFTAPVDGKYKITLTANCTAEDPGGSCFIGFGVGGSYPVGTELTDPFVVKLIHGEFLQESQVYIVDALATQTVQLMFKKHSGVVAFDPIWMTVEKVSD